MVKQGMNLVNDAFQVAEMLWCRIHVANRKQSQKGLLDGFASRIKRRELAEDLVGPRQLHDYLYRAGDCCEDHLAVERRNLPIERKNGPETGGIEDSSLRKIKDKVADARTNLLLAGRFEIGGVPEIQSFADVYDDSLLGPGFNREVHRGDLHGRNGLSYVRFHWPIVSAANGGSKGKPAS